MKFLARVSTPPDERQNTYASQVYKAGTSETDEQSKGQRKMALKRAKAAPFGPPSNLVRS